MLTIDTGAATIEFEIPGWVDETALPMISIISPDDLFEMISWLRDLQYGGCASGMYMPAVVYSDASETMGDHGDAVLQFIVDHYGELPRPRDTESWSGMAVHYLSFAVEMWGSSLLTCLEDENPGDIWPDSE